MLEIMARYKKHVEVIPVDYKYSFGNQGEAKTHRNSVQEYLRKYRNSVAHGLECSVTDSRLEEVRNIESAIPSHSIQAEPETAGRDPCLQQENAYRKLRRTGENPAGRGLRQKPFQYK